MPERARCDYVLQPAHISELGGTSLAVERHVNAKKNKDDKANLVCL